MEELGGTGDAQGFDASRLSQQKQTVIDSLQNHEDEERSHDTASIPTDATAHLPQLMRNTDLGSLSICASPGDDYASPIRVMGKRKGLNIDEPTPSLGTVLRKAAVEHQLGISINLVLLALFSYLLFPSLRPRLETLATLRYPATTASIDGHALYGQGPQDLGIVVAFMVVLTGVRAAMLDYVLMPLAAALGVKKGKASARFTEQAYLILYYLIYWSWGVWIFVADTPASLPASADGSSLPLTINNLLISLWTHYPRLLLNASMKLYYLSQLAFWTQQIIVIHLEERRKDHYQMLTHHFVTVALVVGSYGYRQTRVGNAILVCMDIIDLIFPTAKIFRYLGWQTACDLTFALFVVVWLFCRHGCYLAICWSIHAHVSEVVMPFGLFSLTASTSTSASKGGIVSGYQISADGGENVWSNIIQPFADPAASSVEFNANIKWTFLSLLMGLQFITFLWFLMICRVVVRVVRGNGADDSRSDDEDEGEDADVEEKGIRHTTVSASGVPSRQKYIEVEASSADLTSNTRRSSSKRKSKGLSTGLNLGDHKEILNRIGCLSEEQLAREREKRTPSASRPGSARH